MQVIVILQFFEDQNETEPYGSMWKVMTTNNTLVSSTPEGVERVRESYGQTTGTEA